jgi:PPM family protein phosphatase
VRIATGSATHTGRVRDNNEDSFVVDERLALFAVADGMGGHRGGEVASQTAIEAIRAAVAGGRSIDAAVKAANVAVVEKAAQDPEALAGMGTTMTAVVALPGASLLIAHVGDSRAYLLHDGTLTRRTDDHSLVEELVREGRLTPEQAESHPQRAIVTRALGVDDDVEVDLFMIPVQPGDRVVLCSDGLTTMLRDRDVEQIARQVDDPQRCAEDLVNAAVEAGGEDNVTVVVLDVLEVDETGPPDPQALTFEPPETSVNPHVPPLGAIASDEEAKPAKLAPVQSRRRRIVSIAFVVVPLVVIVAVAMGAIRWYDRSGYFLATDGGDVVLFSGRPDAFIWDPEQVDDLGVTMADLEQSIRTSVRDNQWFETEAAARAFVQRGTRPPPTTVRPRTTTTRPRTAATTARRATTTTQP